MQTIKALGALLHYPQEDLIEALDDIQHILETEALLRPEQTSALGRCIAEMRNQALLDLQEQYVQLFDTTPKHALYLFQHLYGDTPQRGPALADLIGMYRDYGYQPTSTELPDYLPLFCEFAAQFPKPEARALLGRALPVLELIAQRLVQAGSAYAAVFSALSSLAERNENTAAIEKLLNTRLRGGRDQTMDEAWKEQPVTFTATGGHIKHPMGSVTVPIETLTRNQPVRNR
jgi:nitrate reductase delta subunit